MNMQQLEGELAGKTCSVPLCPPHIRHDLTQDQTWAAVSGKIPLDEVVILDIGTAMRT